MAVCLRVSEQQKNIINQQKHEAKKRGRGSQRKKKKVRSAGTAQSQAHDACWKNGGEGEQISKKKKRQNKKNKKWHKHTVKNRGGKEKVTAAVACGVGAAVRRQERAPCKGN